MIISNDDGTVANTDLTSVERQKTDSHPPLKYYCNRLMLGLSKSFWALVCDILAVGLVLLCVPLLLTCSRRRPLGAPLFDFSCAHSQKAESDEKKERGSL